MSRKFDLKKLAYVIVPTSPARFTGLKSVDKVLHTITGGRVPKWSSAYENFIGIKDVKAAQDKVTEVESVFMQIRKGVKISTVELEKIQDELQSVRAKLDRTPRDDPKFLEHATEEHRIIQVEKKLKETVQERVDKERATFDILSAAVRESHTRQKAQEEKTKYLSIIGSILGTCIGVIGSTLISQRRMKDLKLMINDLGEQKGETILISHDGAALSDALNKLEESFGNQSREHLQVILKESLEKTEKILKAQQKGTEKMLGVQEEHLTKEIQSLGRAVAVGAPGDMSTLEEMFGNTEQKLEWEMKMTTLSTVVFIYGAFAITLPILYNIFK